MRLLYHIYREGVETSELALALLRPEVPTKEALVRADAKSCAECRSMAGLGKHAGFQVPAQGLEARGILVMG